MLKLCSVFLIAEFYFMLFIDKPHFVFLSSLIYPLKNSWDLQFWVITFKATLSVYVQFLFENRSFFFWDICSSVQLLGHLVSPFFSLRRNYQPYSRSLYLYKASKKIENLKNLRLGKDLTSKERSNKSKNMYIGFHHN